MLGFILLHFRGER